MPGGEERFKKGRGRSFKENGGFGRFSRRAGRDERGRSESRLGNGGKSYPCGISETKAACLVELSLEPFDLQPIQLLGSHIDQVEQLFYIYDPIDAFVINDHFMNALTHLLSSPTTNSQMG